MTTSPDENILDGGGVTTTEDEPDIYDGGSPFATAGANDRELYYPQLDPSAPEANTATSPFTLLWFALLPTVLREEDQAQNPESGGWPMLSFMESIGHIADDVRAKTADMMAGKWTDPATVPDESVRWLASVLGVPKSQKSVPVPQLRQALIDLTEGRKQPAGTRMEIVRAAKQFLTGDRQVSVQPGTAAGQKWTPTEQALITAMGVVADRILVASEPPLTATATSAVKHVWIDSDTATPHVWADGAWSARTGFTTQAQAVLDQWERAESERAHTITVLAKSDEVPGGDLSALAANIRSVGVIPAGHVLVMATAAGSWDTWEAAVDAQGGSWDALERMATTWREFESIGIALDY